jgi:hypothetical protein
MARKNGWQLPAHTLQVQCNPPPLLFHLPREFYLLPQESSGSGKKNNPTYSVSFSFEILFAIYTSCFHSPRVIIRHKFTSFGVMNLTRGVPILKEDWSTDPRLYYDFDLYWNNWSSSVAEGKLLLAVNGLITSLLVWWLWCCQGLRHVCLTRWWWNFLCIYSTIMEPLCSDGEDGHLDTHTHTIIENYLNANLQTVIFSKHQPGRKI